MRLQKFKSTQYPCCLFHFRLLFPTFLVFLYIQLKPDAPWCRLRMASSIWAAVMDNSSRSNATPDIVWSARKYYHAVWVTMAISGMNRCLSAKKVSIVLFCPQCFLTSKLCFLYASRPHASHLHVQFWEHALSRLHAWRCEASGVIWALSVIFEPRPLEVGTLICEPRVLGVIKMRMTTWHCCLSVRLHKI